MSRRIVSWKISEPRASPAVSNASGGSVVYINPITSDTMMMTTEATNVQAAELGSKLTKWPGSANLSTVESFVQHDIYFFKDGNITFLVRGALCCESYSLKKVAGRWHTLLCSSILFLSGLGILLHQIQPARRPRS
jgi:hypothetical protein